MIGFSTLKVPCPNDSKVIWLLFPMIFFCDSYFSPSQTDSVWALKQINEACRRYDAENVFTCERE
jgi:hypothetical protein